jgi:methylated-DNA-protein-cysteine methyltransferase related protein
VVDQRKDHLKKRTPEPHPGGYRGIYTVINKIPRGKVATYGQIASLAGIPRQARQVGYALHALPIESNVPWQRVINAKGEVSPRKWSEIHLLQRDLLEEEGVVFDERGRVNFKRFRWRPRSPHRGQHVHR